MLNSSGANALLLGIIISILTTSFFPFTQRSSNIYIIIVFGIFSFSVSYLIIYLSYRYFIFKEINKIYDMLNKLSREEYTFRKEGTGRSGDPIQDLYKEISKYVNLKQQEIDELKKLELFRKEFLADVSHELKTPIFSAQGFIHTLLDGAIKDKSVRNKFLKKSAKSLSRLDKLVQDLLVISQMEAGTIKMNYSHFNMNSLVQEVFDQFEGKANKKSLKLKLDELSPEEVYVYADKQKLYQVMINLISNAIKYIKDSEGLVSVKLIPEDETVRIEVSDNGPGIPREDINRIFERFYRVDKSRSKDKGGTGLGLSIVKHIIEAHNQRVSVISRMENGSTFFFNLDKGVKEKALVEEAFDV